MKSLSSITPVRASLPARRLLALLAACSPSIHAAEIFKANNTDAIDQTSSWVGGVVPGAADIAIIDATVAASGTANYFIPQNVNWSVSGIKVLNNANLLVIDSFFASPTPTINLGSAGLNFSGATSGTTFTFDNPTINLTTTQTWSVGDGVTVVIKGALTRSASALLDISYGPLVTGAFVSEFSTANTILPFGTANSGTDFLAVNATQKIVPAATASVYTANPNTGTALPDTSGTFGPINVVNSNTNGTSAFRASNTLTIGSTRFGTSHTAGQDWVVDVNTRNLNCGNTSILVSPVLGTQKVIYNGSTGSVRLGTGSSLTLIQNNPNPSGDLIFNAQITQPDGTGASLIKFGPGRAILASDGNNFAGVTTINAGTLQIGNGGVTGFINPASLVVNNATLAFNRTNNFTFANTVSGSGGLTQAGSGEVNLTGVNTFTGPVQLQSGSLAFSSLDNLGGVANTTPITFSGGALKWNTGNTLDISSSRTLVFSSGSAGLDTNGQGITLASAIGGSGAGGLAKRGAGTLTLQGTNAYQGATTVQAGTLAVANSSGSATGTGAVAVQSTGTLAGTGFITGTVTVNSGATVAPGLSGVGTLTVGGLSLSAGSILDTEVASTSSYDRIVTSTNNGLTVNGGGLRLYNAGGTSLLSTVGTYNLIQFAGSIQGSGLGALSVLNPQAGYRYTFGTASGFVTLRVDLLGMITNWVTNGSGSFTTASNWSNGIPTGAGASAYFNTALGGPATVNLDGNRTLGGLSFNSPASYTIAQGSSGTLFLDTGASDPTVINILNGSHVISAPVGVVSDLSISAATGTSLSFTGLMAGTGDLTKFGPGTLVVSNNNQIVGDSLVSDGVLEFGSLASIGNGSITLNGGTLRYGTGNTSDISGRPVTIGVNDGVIDTNGNNVSFAAAIGNAGLGRFIKQGAGTLTLASGNTYAGATVIRGGKLSISANNRLNANGVGVTLEGGTLQTTATFSTDRVLTVADTGGAVEVASGTTLTAIPAIAGSGLLTKTGAGSLVLSATSTRTGGVTVSEGTLVVRGGTAGTGTVTLANGTVLLMEDTNGSENGGTSTFTGNAITVSSGSNVTMQSNLATNGYFGSITGDVNSTFNITGATQVSFSAGSSLQQFANFLGTVNIASGASLRYSATTFLNNGGQNTTFNVIGNLTARNAGTVNVGALIGTGSVSGSSGQDNNTTIFSIGGKNVDSTFAGAIIDSNLATGRRGAVTKVGTAVLTLTGASTYTGATSVNAGVLRIDGSLGATATTVAAAGTLAGRGTIGGATTVNGILKPAANVANAEATSGQLTFSAALTLGAASTTNIDFSGVVFTGIKSTLNNGVTYGGTLRLNFPGSVFNGSYTLFELTGVPAGAFSAVTITTANAADVPLTNTSGTWSGTDGVAAPSFSFNSTTGVLTVTNAASALTPGAATLSATAGNAKVDLSWTAASNANTYTVRRSTTAGGPYTNVVTNVSGLSYSDTGLTNGTTYYYVVQARNTASGLSGINSNQVSAIPTAVPTRTALQQWRFDEFGVDTDNANVLAGDTEDFDGDGLVNLLEYALGTDPTVANASPVVVGRSGNNLTLTYPRRAVADPALTYTVLGSSDLTTAFTAGAGSTDTNVAGTLSIYTDNVNLSVAGTRRFLRLSVTYTAP